MSARNQTPIAVVGLSALFPGSIDASGFWKDILAGTDLITDVPPSHWLIEDYYDPDPTAPDKTYARRGAFLRSVDFDPIAWGVPPSTVPATDTSQLLALVVAQRVLEDACAGQFSRIDRERTSVILGVTSAQELLGSMVSRLQRPVWVKALRESGLPEDEVEKACDRISACYVEWQESTFPGVLGNVVAGRVANRLDLGGTNCVTDAACASTFAAVSMAVNELRLGDSDLAITGGVDTMNDIFMYMCFSKTPALSPTEDCRPFSDRADGTMLGEGIGMVALKRLEDAERDGDRVYAVLAGIGSSSDGRAKSVYAPLPAGQAKALRRAYAQAGFGPETVELVEAHGTGTKAGDAAEFEGLKTVFDEAGRAERQWCALGSVKSQIGHTKAAAGAAGLFKAVMALHHKVLPPTLKVDRPNPALALEKSPFYLNTTTRPWIADPHHPRRAGVSSFGFGGSNFHLVLEEYAGPAPRPLRSRAALSELVVVTAESAEGLASKCAVLGREAGLEGMLAHLARETQETYDPGASHRLAIVARNEAELAERLVQAQAIAREGRAVTTPTGITLGIGPREGTLGFLFPGQGSHYPGMGADLACLHDDARSAWDLAASLPLDPGTRLHDVAFPKPVFSDAEREALATTLTATEWAQPAIAATSLACLRLLQRLGLEPEAVAGHSFGEVTALHAARVLGAEELLLVARKRGELMAEAAAIPGAMSAVSASIEVVRERIAKWKLDLVIANHNAPTQLVLSGPVEAVADAERLLAAEGIRSKRLKVATAFHSSLVSPALGAFEKFLREVKVAAPALDVYADATAAPYGKSADAVRATLAEQIAKPVRFVELIEAMYARGIRTFVEVGPDAVLSQLVGRILEGRPHTAIPLDRRGQEGSLAFHQALGRMVAAGIPLALGALWAPFEPTRDPRTATKPRFAMPLSGANYGKPYPPVGGASELPPPNPARAEQALAGPASHVADDEETGAGDESRWVASSDDADPTDVRQAEAHESESHESESVEPWAVARRGTRSLSHDALTPGWLGAYSEVQRETADAHAAYQRAMAESHAAFLRTAEASISALSTLADSTGALEEEMWDAAGDEGGAASGDVAEGLRLAPAYAEEAEEEVRSARLPLEHEGVVTGRGELAPRSPLEADEPHLRTAPAGPDLVALLMDVVAEKTGYPAGMLGIEMDLESDLGVDSIKRVEILAAMTALVPGLPLVDPKRLGSLRTLAHVVAYLEGGIAEGIAVREQEPIGAQLAAVTHAAPPAIARAAVRAVEAQAGGLALAGLRRASRVVVTDDGTGVAQALVHALATRGVLAEVVAEVPGDADAVLFLGGLRAFTSISDAIAINREAFRAARAVAERLQSAGGVFVTVQDTGGDFGLGGSERAWLAGLPGLVKCASLEWPKAAVRAIDVERAGSHAAGIAERIARELLEGGGEIEVGLPADGRRVSLAALAERIVPGPSALAVGDLVVVSGGARGVTAACAVALARATGCRLLLLGRSPLVDEAAELHAATTDAALKKALLAGAAARGEKMTPGELGKKAERIAASREVRATLAAIAATGSEARYAPVDVTSVVQVKQALAEARAALGPVRGIVHGAGVLADRLIAEKTDAQFDAVFDTKVRGLEALLEATSGEPLKALVVFSSVAARLGNRGQSDYAMANEVLARVAALERKRRGTLVVKALDWGPWRGGMVTHALEAHFAELGVPLLPLAEGSAQLAAELADAGDATGSIEVVIAPGSVSSGLGAPAPEVRLEVHVSRESWPELDGHRVKGTAVLPVAYALELLARAAAAVRPGAVVTGCQNLRVLRGVRLDGFDGAGDRFDLVASGGPAGTALATLVSADGRPRYAATFTLEEASLEPVTRRLHPAETAPSASPAAGDLYGGVLFHEREFRLLRSVTSPSPGGLVAAIAGSEQAGLAHRALRTDPALVDGALQTALLWTGRTLGLASLPTSIAEVRIRRAGAAPGIVDAVLRGESAANGRVICDVTLSAGGEEWLELRGIETHVLHGTAPEKPARIEG